MRCSPPGTAETQGSAARTVLVNEPVWPHRSRLDRNTHQCVGGSAAEPSVDAVALDRDARAESGFAESVGGDQPHDLLPVPTPRLQQFKHAVIVDGAADERPADLVREVVIATLTESGSPWDR